MTNDVVLSLLYAGWVAASTMPLGFMLGSPCSPCCGCGVADGKPRTDPVNEGTWVPSGTWDDPFGGVTWAFVANPGDDSGETWFFYGSSSTSKIGGGATTAEIRDWDNLCNWYSNKTNDPSDTATSPISGLPVVLNKRATRLPPETAVVHVYTQLETSSPKTVKNIYFWSPGGQVRFAAFSEITTTASAHDSISGCVVIKSVINGTINNGATFVETSRLSGSNAVVNGGAIFLGDAANVSGGTVNNGATFNNFADNEAIVNGGAIFNNTATNFNPGTVNDGATLNNSTRNFGTINNGATFNNNSQNSSGGIVNNGATFNDTSENNAGVAGSVNGSATFNDTSENLTTVNGGATFNDNSINSLNGTVNGGATFNDNSRNSSTGTVNGGATFNGAACSSRTIGQIIFPPCTRVFVAHPTDLPVCNGTAPDGCQSASDSCGCG